MTIVNSFPLDKSVHPLPNLYHPTMYWRLDVVVLDMTDFLQVYPLLSSLEWHWSSWSTSLLWSCVSCTCRGKMIDTWNTAAECQFHQKNVQEKLPKKRAKVVKSWKLLQKHFFSFCFENHEGIFWNKVEAVLLFRFLHLACQSKWNSISLSWGLWQIAPFNVSCQPIGRKSCWLVRCYFHWMAHKMHACLRKGNKHSLAEQRQK